MSEERWKPIPEYGGWYDVSDLGRVRSWIVHGKCRNEKRDIPRILKLALIPNGYLMIALRGNKGKMGTKSVHRLVAVTFLGQPPQGMQVDHRNDCRTDNRLENLRYLTQLENIRRGSWKRRGEKHVKSILTEKDIGVIRERYAAGESAQLIAKDFSVAQSTIEGVVQGRSWKHLKVLSRPKNVVRKCAVRRLTPQDVLLVRRRYAAGDTQQCIAQDLAVHPSSISRIICGHRWKHVK